VGHMFETPVLVSLEEFFGKAKKVLFF